ncbi:hypothetical protein FOH10_29405 [Nocardia otitidiscaviarum]|uniref:N-acetyltransferase domain-containing protein n=1 Tax=Nocardia otitidiscaviarum TaxID=1823 RepID=A0A516NTL7_9NOCA|nr:GNAT family N-acetyltransferase [Nocardia otitidiscaviarum]MCP9621571.1 GNAT family N-acetyltransferase [Nocardia otitidiscaviarum]QDP82238.1 hypothetical protein FOH10_29405 [Nocardia otitidiscaviarum]
MAESPRGGEELTLLIDSNVFIAAEDHTAPGHPFGRQAAELLRLSQKLHYRLALSHGTVSDLLGAPPPTRSQRLKALEKYVVLKHVKTDQQIRGVFPDILTDNNLADLEVLSTFKRSGADWLVTNDRKMRSRAARSDLPQTLSIDAAIELLRPLASPELQAPAAELTEAHTIDLSADIFNSLRADYDDFSEWWLRKVCREWRDVIILGSPTSPEGVAVLKIEKDRPHGLDSPVLKICTFKVADDFRGVKRGELLLKALVSYARRQRLNGMYLEVLPDKIDLIDWLANFGFSVVDTASTARNEMVLLKRLSPSPSELLLPELEYAKRFGPGEIRPTRAHFIPIRDSWHHRLFPEADEQGDLFQGGEACGNAIRKAYLCHSPSRKVMPGDALVFIRTGRGPAAATVIGVAESVSACTSWKEIIGQVGTRTVYTATEIYDMTRPNRAVLVLLFRLDRILSPVWKIDDLLRVGVIKGRTPQSISKISPKGIEWIQSKLGASH